MPLSAQLQLQHLQPLFYLQMFRHSSQILVRHALQSIRFLRSRSAAHERCGDAYVVAAENELPHLLFLQPLLSLYVSCCPFAPNPSFFIASRQVAAIRAAYSISKNDLLTDSAPKTSAYVQLFPFMLSIITFMIALCSSSALLISSLSKSAQPGGQVRSASLHWDAPTARPLPLR